MVEKSAADYTEQNAISCGQTQLYFSFLNHKMKKEYGYEIYKI